MKPPMKRLITTVIQTGMPIAQRSVVVATGHVSAPGGDRLSR
jgi:hypothetical protein